MNRKLKGFIIGMLCSFLIINVFFVQTYAKETELVKETFLEESSSFLFDDVKDPEKSFYNAVYWAYENGITTGTSKEPPLFSPFATCTRAQFVTFLWRQMGKPEPTLTESPFVDVQNKELSYYQAVLWALENKITTGTSDTTFDPGKKVTRGQVAAFLYRAAGKPEVTGENPFNDVPAGRSFTEAVIWMVEHKITTGTSPTTFKPDGDCQRGATVTFLYRANDYLSPPQGKTEYFDDGDYTYTPAENDIIYDEEENDLYYRNLLVVYTFDEITDEEADELAALVDGEVVGKITGAINAMQIRTAEKTLSGLEVQAELLMNNEKVMYARAEYPIEIPEENADNNPWSNGAPESDRGNESNPDGNDWWAEAIGAYSAWEYSSQASPMKIGILDNGFITNHPDLSGQIQFLPGYTGNTIDPKENAPYHGTHVAGIIGAKNNNIGIRGIADQATLYCVDWTLPGVSYFSSLEYFNIYKRMIENGVKVINNSWGSLVYSEKTYKAQMGNNADYHLYLEGRKKAAEKAAENCILFITDLLWNGYEDFLIVQSAGNGYDTSSNGIDASLNSHFCAINEKVYNGFIERLRDIWAERGITYRSVEQRKIIVGAADNVRNSNGYYQMRRSSNFGDNVDIFAPGGNIFSTVRNSEYGSMGGTSMASPMVAASAAYVWSLNPSLSAPEVKNILLSEHSTLVYGIGDDSGSLYPMLNVGLAARKAVSDIHYYNVYLVDPMSWEEANEFCRNLDGHLATISSQEENDYVFDLMRRQGFDSAYFGLTDQSEEGNWRWVTGETVKFMNWHPGEPNQENTNEDYAMFFYKFSDGTWNDGDFGANAPNEPIAIICEWESEDAFIRHMVIN